MTLVKKLITKILNSELVILLQYQNIKTSLQKVTLKIGPKKFLWLRKFKILCRGHVIKDINEKEIVGTFYENELQQTNQKEFRIERVIKRKDNKLYVKWKGHNNSFNSWIDKKSLV